MNRRNHLVFIAVLSIIVFSTSTVFSTGYQPPIYDEKDLPVVLPEISPLNITVVFVGFDPTCINTSYMTWLLPQWKPQEVLIPEND